jgi:hypothetical protein
MAAHTYYVTLPFLRDEDGALVAGEPREARSAEQAARYANLLATSTDNCGAIAFSRSGDPATGDFDDAVVLKSVGEVDAALVGV